MEIGKVAVVYSSLVSLQMVWYGVTYAHEGLGWCVMGVTLCSLLWFVSQLLLTDR